MLNKRMIIAAFIPQYSLVLLEMKLRALLEQLTSRTRIITQFIQLKTYAVRAKLMDTNDYLARDYEQKITGRSYNLLWDPYMMFQKALNHTVPSIAPKFVCLDWYLTTEKNRFS